MRTTLAATRGAPRTARSLNYTKVPGRSASGLTPPVQSPPAGVLALTRMHCLPTSIIDAGGEGIVIGDGKLPVYGLEQEIETYYKFVVTADLAVSVDYEFYRNPGYNTQRGPVNIFAGRIHLTF
jgi:hypothetical protein